jgi:hypothetical protein
MPTRLDLALYQPHADGVSDDSPALHRCFAEAARAGGGTIVIPPGDYFVAGSPSIPIPSGTTVFAHGARFCLPEVMGDRARLVLFEGRNVTDFAWHGGAFQGHCFDHRHPPNTWEPNANSRIFVVNTSAGGRTDNLLFREIQSTRVGGAVINVEGAGIPGSESGVDTFATRIAVRDCLLTDSGKFMWDYGLLWQILVWPEEYTAADVDMARKYFRSDLIREPVRLADGDDRVWLDNRQAPVPVSASADCDQAICFLGGVLPRNLVRGRKYYVVESCADYLRIASAPGAAPLRFEGSAGGNTGLIVNLSQAFYHLYAPTHAGPGKGCIDLVCCRGTSLTGNRISALGDTMHVQRCHNNVFAQNQILGSRMGAFFLAEFCKDSTITGNTVDGTNGSRIVSVEKSNEDVTLIGNTFRGGGRGSWINQPKRLIIQGNIFVNNTTKGERNPWRGRKSFETGDYEGWAEMYFTLHEKEGQYGPVVLRDNLFVTGPECREAITFARQGHDLEVSGNTFEGPARTVNVEPGCTNVHIGANLNQSL